MQNGRITAELIKEFKAIIDGAFTKPLNDEEARMYFENCPKSELPDVTVHYAISPMATQVENALEIVKQKVEETLSTIRNSKFNFSNSFRELILFMSPVMPVLDENLKYIGVGTQTQALRVNSEKICLLIHANYLTNKKEYTFNGILSHELLDLLYSEQNTEIAKKARTEVLCDIPKEIAIDERVYAINPRYCIDMQQTCFEYYFRRTAVAPLFYRALAAPSIYLPILKHQDHSGKHLRKRVLDFIRRYAPREEPIALKWESILAGIPLYSPSSENYSHAEKSMIDFLSRF